MAFSAGRVTALNTIANPGKPQAFAAKIETIVTARTTVSLQPGFYTEDQGNIDIRFPFNNKVITWLMDFHFAH